MNVFQSNLSGIFVDECSLYLASRLIGKIKGKGVGEIWLIDGVDGSDNVSGSDDDVVVSVEISVERIVGVSGNIPIGFSGVPCDGDWGISK